MAPALDSEAARRTAPYAVTALGLVGGLIVLLLQPLPTPALNYLVGGGALAAAVLAVAYMVIAGGGPGRRGPDFE